MTKKTLRNYIPLLVALALLQGCASTGDPILVTAEKATQTGFYTARAFVKLEANNESLGYRLTPGGEIHQAAEAVRLHLYPYTTSVRRLTAAYKANSNDATKSALGKALSDLSALLDEVNRYYPMLTSAVTKGG